MDPHELDELDLEYAEFNALKTVSDERPSCFTSYRFGPLLISTDPNRRASYYQRLLGLSKDSLAWLPRLEGHPLWGSIRRIELPLRADEATSLGLQGLGFRPREHLIWMILKDVPRAQDQRVVPLSPRERDQVLPLLELEGPIDGEIWKVRREHFCTDRYRIFGVFEDDQPIAIGTTFLSGSRAILGNAFTHPDHRGRGFQTALLATRCHQALASGASTVLTDVEPNSSSLRNCLRGGFAVLCEKSIWERDEVPS